MLKFNTYRSARYLRSKFVEGKYLLASEATDLELEILELLRKVVKDTIGDVALADAWKVERLSDTQILIKPGEAWFKGFPFSFRSGKDQLVSGATLSEGIVPVGVAFSDDATGLGKIITFNSGNTTPTNLYRMSVVAREELVNEVDDPFLQNANLTESTAQKVRVLFQINIVPDSLQTESPISYRDENSSSLSVTNFPNTGGQSAPNLNNQIVVTPTFAGNGHLISLNLISGSEKIDGRDLELVLRNDTGIGGGHPIPKSPTEQAAFANGKLIDSYGNIYHVNAIFNDIVSTQVVIRIDKEVDQQNPEIVDTLPFTLVKRDLFVTDDINGAPQGRLYWDIAKLDWNQVSGITHSSRVTDLRNVAENLIDFENAVAKKNDLILTGGGQLSFAADTVTWSSDLDLVSAYGPVQTISANTAVLPDGGSLVYELDLQGGGVVSRGNLAITVLSSGSTITVGALDDLTDVRLGNIIKRGSEVAKITSINNVSKLVGVSPALTTTGAATIYKDAFGSQSAPFSLESYVLAVRKNGKILLGGGAVELEDGETNQLGDSVSAALLTYIGATDETDDDPFYSSVFIVTQGNPLPDAISELDAEVNNINTILSAPLYDERILYPSGLASLTNITIPNNSRDSGNPHFFTPGSGELMVFLNQQYKYLGVDYVEVDNQTIKFNYALANDSEVHFRDADIGGFGSGSGDLQSAYNIGRTITTSSGNPVEISGPPGKLLKINGDMEVTGVIDPTGIELTPMAANPLGAGKKGVWVNLSNELVHEDGTSSKNIIQSIDDLESGLGVNALTRLMFNGTLSTIPKGTPIYSPSAGNIAPADGTNNTMARVIGIAAENIAPSTNGMVAYAGMLTGVTGYTHGAYLYLDQIAGGLVDTEPTLGPYPSGFNVVIIGVMENNNIMLQIHHVGVL